MALFPNGLASARTIVEGFPASVSIPRDWSYAIAGKRDLRIDLLRGFAVLMMVVNHFGGASWLFLVTGGDAFFVSAAEAFIFISGLTVGMVYGGIALKEGLRAAQLKAVKRAWTLYKLTVVLTLLLATVSFYFGLPWITALRVDNPILFAFDVLTLRQTLYLSDVMLMYTFLMLAAPIALWLLCKHRARLLMFASGALWLAFQIARVDIPWQITGNVTFNLAAWQLLFFVAMVLGYHRGWVKRMLIGLPRAPSFFLFALFALALIELHQTASANSEIHAFFIKSAVAPGRLLASFVFFSFAYLAATLLWKPIWAALGWLLMPLGQNALYAYTMHVGVIALWYIALTILPADVRMIAEINTSIQLVAVLAIWTMIQKQFLFRIVPR